MSPDQKAMNIKGRSLKLHAHKIVIHLQSNLEGHWLLHVGPIMAFEFNKYFLSYNCNLLGL